MKHFSRKDILIITLIIGITFSYYLLAFIREGITSINFYFFELEVFGFNDFISLIIYTKMKILIIIFTITWYFNCDYWWKHAILVITSIELMKLITAFDDEIKVFDEIDYIFSLPITIPLIMIIIFISYKLNKFNSAQKIKTSLDAEIDSLFFEINDIKEDKVQMINSLFDKIKKTKTNQSRETYLEKLMVLKNKFYN